MTSESAVLVTPLLTDGSGQGWLPPAAQDQTLLLRQWAVDQELTLDLRDIPERGSEDLNRWEDTARGPPCSGQGGGNQLAPLWPPLQCCTGGLAVHPLPHLSPLAEARGRNGHTYLYLFKTTGEYYGHPIRIGF